MTKRNTKIALASVLAVSAIAPVAVAAETAPASKEINFTITDERNQVGSMLKGPGKLSEKDGKKYITVTLDAATAEMVKDVTVDGKSVLVSTPVGTLVNFPVTDNLDPVKASVKVFVAAINREVSTEFTLTPEKAGAAPTPAPTPAPAPAPVKPADLKYLQYYPIADGTYDVTFDAFSAKTGEGNYGAITNQLDKAAKLVVEDGKYYLEVQEVKRFKTDADKKPTDKVESWITEYQVLVDGKYVKAEFVEGELHEYPHVVRLPITELNGKTKAKLHVVAEAHNMDHWYDFDFAINKGQNLPQEYPTYVYKDGENAKSIMEGKYLSSSTSVELKENGKYDVNLKFPEGQYMVDLIIGGKSIAVSDSYEEKVTLSNGKEMTNTVKIYTVEVDNLSDMITATFDLDIPGMYTEAHDAQIQIGGKKNPFSDVMKSFAYGNIVSLYSKGIFVEADKFNPSNKLQRSHFALMMNRAFELEVPETTKFTDIAKLPAEEQVAIKALNNYGIVNGSTPTTFNPKGDIKRYEAALMVTRMLEKQGFEIKDGLTTTFTDLGKSDAETKKAIAFLFDQNIISGKSPTKFDPNGTLTRQEMAKILDKTLTLIENK